MHLFRVRSLSASARSLSNLGILHAQHDIIGPSSQFQITPLPENSLPTPQRTFQTLPKFKLGPYRKSTNTLLAHYPCGSCVDSHCAPGVTCSSVLNRQGLSVSLWKQRTCEISRRPPIRMADSSERQARRVFQHPAKQHASNDDDAKLPKVEDGRGRTSVRRTVTGSRSFICWTGGKIQEGDP